MGRKNKKAEAADEAASVAEVAVGTLSQLLAPPARRQRVAAPVAPPPVPFWQAPQQAPAPPPAPVPPAVPSAPPASAQSAAAKVKRRSFLPEAPTDAFPAARKKAKKAADKLRLTLDIRIEDEAGTEIPAPITSFEELDVLPAYVVNGLKSHSIVTPMPIQAQALPIILGGSNVIGLAQTGSGKTLAFLLPGIVHCEAEATVGRHESTPIVLVLAPTRELAVQINDEAGKVLKGSYTGNHPGGVWSTCVYGGASKAVQIRSAQGCHIVAATPGRLKDLVDARHMTLSRVTYFALDEADRMLDLGFQGEVADISAQLRKDHQIVFFSATWQQQVQALARGLCENGEPPVRMAVGQKEGGDADEQSLKARESITQQVIVLDHGEGAWEQQTKEKNELLEKHLQKVLVESDENKVLVFVSQKDFADNLCQKLWDLGFHSGAMHGGKAQESRLNTLEKFRKGEIRLLVATDVLGRGIDIPSVSHVVVYEMGTVEDYIHRIGRTARGKDAKGHALVFFEYHWKFPTIASELINVLETSMQPVPEELRKIAKEVDDGKRRGPQKAGGWNSWGWKNKGSWQDGGDNGWKSGWKKSWNSDNDWSKKDGKFKEQSAAATNKNDETSSTASNSPSRVMEEVMKFDLKRKLDTGAGDNQLSTSWSFTKKQKA